MLFKKKSSPKPIPGLNILTAIILWLLSTTGGALYFCPKLPNAIGISILFFNNLNILIALCEIGLGLHIKFIQDDYKKLKSKYRGKELEAVLAYLLMPLSLSQLFEAKKWVKMWSTYALYDPSYQNNESFGFFIDYGNGMSTIPPCLLWNFAIIYPEQCSPLLVGTVGLCSYWQVLYGTVIYLLSYIFNRRYVGRSPMEILGFVGFTNSLWFFFPVAALYAAVIMLRDGDLSVFYS
mmetsp:Transcript_14505/g.20463  ORF Transcript_14505/g.20463 Transcript_14505/m.20463 type:complete len:236 (-) Transcript_14505:46-753(-)